MPLVNILSSLSKLRRGCKIQGQRSISRSKYNLSTNNGRNKRALFRVILTEKSISYIIFMIQGHFQAQKVNFKVK